GLAPVGGGVLVQGGTLALTNDVVANNQAVAVNPGDSAQGGGVAVTGGGALTATGTTFRSNLARGAVGADGNTHLQFTGSFFEEIILYGAGGAISFDGAALTLSGDTFRDNQALGGRGGTGASGSGTSSFSVLAFNDFGGTGTGGGVYVRSGALTVAGSTFTGNVARGGDGGQALGGQFSFDDGG